MMVIKNHRLPGVVLSFCLLFIAGTAVFAQVGLIPGVGSSAQIRGIVRYSDWGVVAENVVVKLESFQGGTVAEIRTDRTGKFAFTGLAPAVYVLTAHAQGYFDDKKQLDLQTTNS